MKPDETQIDLPCPGGSGRRSRRDPRRGAALVEFALIAFVLYLLLSVMLDFGRLMYCANVLQDVAAEGAAELSKMTLPATYTFEQALEDEEVRKQIYDERHLVIDLDNLAPGETVVDYANRVMPLINRRLVTLMIPERELNLLRYPGALVWRFDPSGGGGYPTVLIPEVLDRPVDGGETIRLRKVVEEVKVESEETGEVSGSFSVTAAVNAPGRVLLRINYPYQAATLSAFKYTDQDGNPIDGIPVGEDVINFPIIADDGSVRVREQPGGYALLGRNGDDVGPYAGTYGLGLQYGMNRQLRPYSKLLVQQGQRQRETYK